MIRIRIDVGVEGVVIRDEREYPTIMAAEKRYRRIQRAHPDAALTVWEVYADDGDVVSRRDGVVATQLKGLFT